MYTSVLVSSALVVFLAQSSLQEAHEEAGRVTRAYSGGGRGYSEHSGRGQGFGSDKVFRGSQGYTNGQGFRGEQGFGGNQGGFGGQSGDFRYGFNIVDTPEKYGYEANYPGGRTSFFLLGPVGPGQQKGQKGVNNRFGGGHQKGWNAGRGDQGYDKGQSWMNPNGQGYNKGQTWNNNQGHGYNKGQHWVNAQAQSYNKGQAWDNVQGQGYNKGQGWASKPQTWNMQQGQGGGW